MQFFLSAELIQNLFSSALLYFVPNKVAGRIPLPVRGQSTVMSIFCMPVCKRISRTTNPIFTNFVHFTYCRGTILLWWQYDTLCTSGFMDDVMFVHKRQEWATQKSVDSTKGSTDLTPRRILHLSTRERVWYFTFALFLQRRCGLNH